MDLQKSHVGLDLGCGDNKLTGYFGVDIRREKGVDLVMDLAAFPWPLPENQFENIRCSHILEHLDDIPGFLAEIHRVSKPGAVVHFTTPHFSSINSWSDPTHRRHLSTQWYKTFTEGYLSKDPRHRFEVQQSTVSFGRSVFNFIPKLIIRLRGIEYWEKKYAFRYPGVDIDTYLRVVK